MECLICGNHDECDDQKLVICDQCDNGLMVPINTVIISMGIWVTNFI